MLTIPVQVSIGDRRELRERGGLRERSDPASDGAYKLLGTPQETAPSQEVGPRVGAPTQGNADRENSRKILAIAPNCNESSELDMTKLPSISVGSDSLE